VRLNTVLKTVATVLFFSFFFISFLQRHVYNYDFWWHLATGKYIVETQSLPQSDPFAYTAHDAPSARKAMILKGYWLAQVIFYKIYSLWDLKGIIVLRALLMSLFLFFVFLTVKKQGLSTVAALIPVAGVFFIAGDFIGERPQLFTFLFFSVALYLLEDFRVNRSKKIFLLPVLTVLLANMHPGYIVCILLISLYLAGEVILALIKKEAGDGGMKILFVVWVLSLLSVFFNPSGFSVFGELSTLEKHVQGIVEFMPTFYVYSHKYKPLDYSYIIYLFLSLLSFRYLKKIGLVHMLVLFVFTLMSFTAIRFMIFYMAVSSLILARIMLNLKKEKGIAKFVDMLGKREGLLYLIASFVAIVLVFNAIPSLARYEFRADTSFAAPKGAADFLAGLKIRGNMFNEYSTGGYLIWRLYPDKKVFIDGRSLEPDVYAEYVAAASAKVGPDGSWEDILNKYNISYVITPPLLPRGEVIPIVEKLFDRKDWTLIYNDQLSLIFMQNSPENKEIINKFGKDKRDGLATIIIQASARATKNKANPYYLITLGKTFIKMGKLDDAEKAFALAYQRDPNNPMITEWLKKLQENKEGRH
jgi:hypothetical protein